MFLLPQRERKEILEAFKWVDEVVLTKHSSKTGDMSVCTALKDIFANGGDRTRKNIPEIPLCKSIGCKMVFNVGRGGKIQSSSWLVEKYRKESFLIKMKKSEFKILTYQNYLQMIKASRGSQMFRRLYVLEGGKKRDILRNGELSCAYYVSSILKIFDLISQPHAVVKSTIEDMLENSWRPTKKLKAGNVLVWEEKKFPNGQIHKHIGFYLGKDRAISNAAKKGVPAIHHFTYGQTKSGQPKRKIIQILTHRIIK
jgi:glycerol-3-phosphate cytidylyltransferase-like family protein